MIVFGEKVYKENKEVSEIYSLIEKVCGQKE